MRKDFGAHAHLYPMPVLMIGTYCEDGTPDIMNAGWGGVCGWHEVFLALDKNHRTTKNILARRAFTVSPADAAHTAPCDYLGLVSQDDVPDKAARAGFHTTPSVHVDAPLIDKLPFTLECRLLSYDPETEYLIGEVVNLSVDERILTADGKIDVNAFGPIALDPINSVYRRLGEQTGRAFHDGRAFMPAKSDGQ